MINGNDIKRFGVNPETFNNMVRLDLIDYMPSKSRSLPTYMGNFLFCDPNEPILDDTASILDRYLVRTRSNLPTEDELTTALEGI